MAARPGPSSHPAPWLTWLCCALCVVVTAGHWFAGAGPEHRAAWGNFPSEAIWDGRYGALVSAVFVHAHPLQNPFHLLFNVSMLARFGAVVEQSLGHLEWAVFCLAAAFVASGAELAAFGHTGIGASGVVYALFGLTWGARSAVPAFALVATDDNVRFLLGWMVLTFVLTTFGQWNIANAAHAGGLLFGLAVAWLFVQKPLPPARRALAAALLAALVILAVLSVTWLPWSPRWQVWRAGRQTASVAAPLAGARGRYMPWRRAAAHEAGVPSGSAKRRS